MPQRDSNNPQPIDPNLIRSWIENQRQELQNRHTELDLKAKEIEANKSLALKSLELQGNILKNHPKEFRKTITRVGYIVGAVILLIMGFLSYCLWMGKDEFAKSVLHISVYLVSVLASYWFGRKNGKNEAAVRNNGNGEAQVIE